VSFALAVAQNQSAVIAMSEPQMREILSALRDIQDTTERGMTSLLKSGRRGYSIQRQQAQYLQVERAIREIERRLPGAAGADLRSGSARVSETAIRRMQRMIREGEQEFAGAVTSLRLPVARVLATVDQTLMHRHASAAAKYAGDVGRRARREMMLGVIQGESPGQIANRLLTPAQREAAVRRGPRAIAEAVAENQFVRNKSDALRLVRTELVNAYSVTEIESLREADEEDPGYLKMWDATSDLRTCRDCARLNSKIAPLDRPFPGGVWHPPLHPNDRCTVTPWHSGWGRPRR
jgi:SPP1 gp7 family putative phage head morphogenesis protein